MRIYQGLFHSVALQVRALLCRVTGKMLFDTRRAYSPGVCKSIIAPRSSRRMFSVTSGTLRYALNGTSNAHQFRGRIAAKNAVINAFFWFICVLVCGGLFLAAAVKYSSSDFFSKLLPDTAWVQCDSDIYFLNKNNVGVIALDGSQVRRIFNAPGKIIECRFSRNGQEILVRTWDAVFRVYVGDGKFKKLERNEFAALENDFPVAFGPWEHQSPTKEKQEKKLIVANYLYIEDRYGLRRPIAKLTGSRKGDPALRNVRWLPGGQFALMDSHMGILVYDSVSGKIGKLIKGTGFGWPVRIKNARAGTSIQRV